MIVFIQAEKIAVISDVVSGCPLEEVDMSLFAAISLECADMFYLQNRGHLTHY